jgi:flagellar assembly protein FliH
VEAQRIPAQSIESVSAWQIPELNGEHVVYINDDESNEAPAPAALPRLGDEVQEAPQTKRVRMNGSELEQMVQSAREEGYSQGLSKGQSEGEAQGLASGEQQGLANADQRLASALSALQQATAQAPEQLRLQQEQVQEAIAVLVHKVSAAVIGRELEVAPANLTGLVHDVAMQLDEGEHILRVFVNSADYDVLQQHAEAGNWHWVGDDNVRAGGCRIETNFSAIDASVEQRLQDAVADLYGRIKTQGA